MRTHLKAYGYRMAVAFGIVVLFTYFIPKEAVFWFTMLLLMLLITLPLEVIFYYLGKGKSPHAIEKLENLKGLLSAVCCLILSLGFR